MENTISKEELARLKKIKGEARGAGIKSNLDFIIQREGKESLRKIEKRMAEIGYPLAHKEVRMMNFYPLALESALLLVIREIFGYGEKEFQEMGRFGAKSSLIIKLFMRYFISFEKFISKPPEMWKRYFTVGSLELEEYNENKRYAIVKIKDFYLNPFHCQLLSGFLSALLGMMIKTKVKGEETKCPSRGDEYHEFLLKW